jgi:mycofactocin precursor
MDGPGAVSHQTGKGVGAAMSEKEQEAQEKEVEVKVQQVEVPSILEEITIEELAVDGICGIY